MTALLPAAVYGLEVVAGDILVPADFEFPAGVRITMAALNPTAAPEYYAGLPEGAPPRATLKLVRVPLDQDESDDDEDEDSEMDALINGDSDEDSDEEANGGPSDPAKSKKARREAAIQALKDSVQNDEDDDEEDEEMGGVNGKINKGKAVALGDDDDSDEDSDDIGMEEFVLCTLDPNTHYQQPLDIHIAEKETVYFKVTGTHSIYLTGNYVMPVDDGPSGPGGEELDYDSDDEELDYDLEEESDDLDDIDDPRITELDSEEEIDAPKLVSAKSNKKRAAEDESLDAMMAQAEATNGLSKKQQKKLKNNAGEAAAAPATKEDKKKVQFAEKLEQGPTGSTADKKGKKDKKDEKKEDKKEDDKPAGGIRTVQGVKIDERKTGKGKTANKGSSIDLRYIGKLENGQVFDQNKKGKPLSFKVGAGAVIKGMDLGVEGMTAGSERRITIPAKLGYGTQTVPGIPKNSVLIFDVKCLSVK